MLDYPKKLWNLAQAGYKWCLKKHTPLKPHTYQYDSHELLVLEIDKVRLETYKTQVAISKFIDFCEKKNSFFNPLEEPSNSEEKIQIKDENS
jgi:hypothetical protein